jgi:hypothetical protein
MLECDETFSLLINLGTEKIIKIKFGTKTEFIKT